MSQHGEREKKEIAFENFKKDTTRKKIKYEERRTRMGGAKSMKSFKTNKGRKGYLNNESNKIYNYN